VSGVVNLVSGTFRAGGGCFITGDVVVSSDAAIEFTGMGFYQTFLFFLSFVFQFPDSSSFLCIAHHRTGET
jgi:hypothetical protein